MRQTKFSLELSKRIFLALVMVGILVPPVWAYIEAGTYNSTLNTHRKRLEAAGWAVNYGQYHLSAALPDRSTSRDSVNWLVANAVHALPKEDAAKVSSETKREIARIARETIERAVTSGQDIVKKGQTGSLRYHVGTLWYKYDWADGNVRRDVRRLEHRSARIPFVALMPTDRVYLAEARITVLVPADAKVFFDGESTTQTGSERLYITPRLKAGKNYQYELVARWQENGRETKQSRRVTVTGDGSARVNFFTEEK
ncbi:MAG TPA: TIGR03000 domain-containing protein [Gemmataceae bacterium]|nr:TIGR03000 domain-containing protein [Gemmataceae bacterium]